jgi:hypothetical protein
MAQSRTGVEPQTSWQKNLWQKNEGRHAAAERHHFSATLFQSMCQGD